MNHRESTNSPIDISVLIATRNRAPQLRETLQCFSQLQLADLTWELIVVDNGSEDDTSTVLNEATEFLPLIHLDEPVAGKNRALNKALPIAQGKLFVFTDDDILPAANWLSELHAATTRWPDDNIFGGTIFPKFPKGTPDWLCDPEFSYSARAFGRNVIDSPEGPVKRAPFGGNLAIRAEQLAGMRFSEQIGPAGMHYAMGSETELLVRLKNQHGLRFIYVPTASVEHVIEKQQTTLGWLFGRAFRLGRGSERLSETRTGTAAPIPIWKMHYHVFRAALRHFSRIRRPEAERFESGKRLHFLRGRLAERRRIVKENQPHINSSHDA